jgi:dienelactone hydrolase
VTRASAWNGAAWGILAALAAIVAVTAVSLGGGGMLAIAVTLGLPLGLAFVLAAGIAIALLVRVLAALPWRLRLVLGGSLFLLFFELFTGSSSERLIPTFWVIVPSLLVGGGAGALRAWRIEKRGGRPPILALACLVAGAVAGVFAARWLFSAGAPNPPAADAAKAGPSVPDLDLPDPSRPGDHHARLLFYGSGADRRRPEYGARVDLRTRPVDGRPFLHGWTGLEGWARTRFWGFDASALPLNGRLWIPDGDGPFPLVIVVHGNHPMEDFSEPGYDYLGEHLATHGFAAALVDENFLNLPPWSDVAGDLSGENAARAFLVLAHLDAFRAWNADAASPLHGKLDLDRIALAGHSRGGEAIAVAAAFNRLPRLPDDATVTLPHGFGIRALVALAPTDGQYQPGGVRTPLEGVDFLAIGGSNDGDVQYFRGVQQYDRTEVRRVGYGFKAAVYVHGANHGQFNRGWGRLDKVRFPKRYYYEPRAVLPAEAQEQVAKAYVTAFLAASLRGDRRWLPFLADHRAGRRWLPDTVYVSRFEDSSYRPVLAFDEDVDPTTATHGHGEITGDHLTTWREQSSQPGPLAGAAEGRAVVLGWDTAASGAARYAVSLPEAPFAHAIEARDALVITLADANEGPRPRGAGRGRPRDPIDLTVELADRAGHVARLPLGSASLLQPALESSVWKGWTLAEPRRENVFQTIALPLARFVAQDPALDVGQLASIRLVFDRTPAGTVVVRGLGFASPPPP